MDVFTIYTSGLQDIGMSTFLASGVQCHVSNHCLQVWGLYFPFLISLFILFCRMHLPIYPCFCMLMYFTYLHSPTTILLPHTCVDQGFHSEYQILYFCMLIYFINFFIAHTESNCHHICVWCLYFCLIIF